ncbi:MAG: hypothetical protein HY328_02845 [Chloroflexi bacterium]|nr:hypothetical protein [Chloroflexota bacterium]
MNVTYRVFQEENGQYTFREVFTEHNGQVITYGRTPVMPIGESLDALAGEIEWFKEALLQPALTVEAMEQQIAKQSTTPKAPRKAISHAELMAKLELDKEDRQDAVELPMPSHAN